MLKVECIQIVSGLRRNTIILPHDSLLASSRLYGQQPQLLPVERAGLRWRGNNNFIRAGFKGIQGFLTDERFIFLKAKGEIGAWKLDRNPEWALEHGKAFDALVRYDPLRSQSSLSGR